MIFFYLSFLILFFISLLYFSYLILFFISLFYFSFLFLFLTQFNFYIFNINHMSKIKKNQKSQILEQVEQFVPFGSLRNDGTFTQKVGQGSGSHHGGVKYILYIKKSSINDNSFQNENIMMTTDNFLKKKQSDSSMYICQKCQNKQKEYQQKDQKINKKTSKIKTKVSLRDTCRTRNQKKIIYQKVNTIFQNLYKDQYQMVEQQLDDQILLLMNSICHLYGDLQQANCIIKSLQTQPFQKASKLSQKTQIKLNRKIQAQQKLYVIQNQQLHKKIQILNKQKQKLNQKNKLLIIKGKQIQKILKKIQPKYYQNQLKSNKQIYKQTQATKTKQTGSNKTKQSNNKSKKNKKESMQNSGLDSFSFFSDQQIQKDFTIQEMIKRIS